MSKIISGEKPLVIPPQLATKIGRWEALILQQIHHHCQHSKHVIDGAKWFWKTFKNWAEQIPFISLGTIRRAIVNLRKMELITVKRLSAPSHYQANWYTVNYEFFRSQCASADDRGDQMDAIAESTSISETNSSENLSTHTPPQPPTTAELVEAERELRECRINPDAVRRELLKWFANFKGAIARVKEAQHQGWCTSPTGVFVKSIRLGLKPESPNFSREQLEIPAPPEGLEDWAIAHSDEVQDFFYSSIHKCWRVVYVNGSQADWWEAMEVENVASI